MGKIPTQAEKVFSGEIFDTYQWPQTIFNGKTATFEMLNRPDCTAVIPVTSEGKILVSKQKQPNTDYFWGVFGGRMEEGETPLENAQRELQEESGYTSSDWHEFGHQDPIQKIDWRVHYFIAKNCVKTDDQNLDGGEIIEVHEVNWEEFVDMCRQDKIRETGIQLKILLAIANGKLEELKEVIYK